MCLRPVARRLGTVAGDLQGDNMRASAARPSLATPATAASDLRGHIASHPRSRPTRRRGLVLVPRVIRRRDRSCRCRGAVQAMLSMVERQSALAFGHEVAPGVVVTRKGSYIEPESGTKSQPKPHRSVARFQADSDPGTRRPVSVSRRRAANWATLLSSSSSATVASAARSSGLRCPRRCWSRLVRSEASNAHFSHLGPVVAPPCGLTFACTPCLVKGCKRHTPRSRRR